jgi:hypothetical protein
MWFVAAFAPRDGTSGSKHGKERGRGTTSHNKAAVSTLNTRPAVFTPPLAALSWQSKGLCFIRWFFGKNVEKCEDVCS